LFISEVNFTGKPSQMTAAAAAAAAVAVTAATGILHLKLVYALVYTIFLTL